MRQALAQIRKTHESGPQLIDADKQFVWLRPTAFVIAMDDGGDQTVPSPGTAELLQGADIRDNAFEEWLRDVRLANEAHRRARPGTPLTGERTAPPRVPRLLVQLCIARPAVDPRSPGAALVADVLVDQLIGEALTLGIVAVADGRNGTFDGLRDAGLMAGAVVLNSRAVGTDSGILVQVSALSGHDETVLWHANATIRANRMGPDNLECGQLVNRFIDFLITFSAGVCSAPINAFVSADAGMVMKGLFAPSRVSLAEMERCIARAIEAAPNGPFHALRGTINLLKYAERFGSSHNQVADLIHADLAAAMERAPQNGLVHAMVGHAHGLFFGNGELSLELTELAVKLAPANALCWTLHALALSRASLDQQAYAACQRALSTGRNSFFRPFIETAICICAANAADVERAVTHGEHALQGNPGFGTTLRYLFAAYAHAGRMRDAEAVHRKWLSLEPDLSMRLLRSRDYPIAVERSREFIVSGARRYGLQ